MRASAAFLLAACLLFPAGAMAGPAAPLPLSEPSILTPAKLVCGMVNGKLKCKNVKDGTIGFEFDDGKKKKDAPEETGDDADEGGQVEGEAGGGVGADDANGGGGGGGMTDDADGDAGGGGADDAGPEAVDACPEGYKRLDPPSKFGPCEPPEGLPNNAYVQCPTGATGTPPNCTCPDETKYGPRGNQCLDCPPGSNILEEKTKYGSFCEPPGGLPNNAYRSCPKGATGTPPNCTCPTGSNYGTMGNKCVPAQ